jgi:hypothetical protein
MYVDNLELFLKRKHHPSNTNLNPAPIKFESEKLNRVHPAVDLRRYDALYFEGENQGSASKEEKENGNDDEQHPARGSVRAEAEVLESGDERGSIKDEGSRARSDHKILESVDIEGEIGTTQLDDRKQDQDG